jgi:hypothetical protein
MKHSITGGHMTNYTQLKIKQSSFLKLKEITDIEGITISKLLDDMIVLYMEDELNILPKTTTHKIIYKNRNVIAARIAVAPPISSMMKEKFKKEMDELSQEFSPMEIQWNNESSPNK